MNVSAERVGEQIASLLHAWGMRDDLARTTTEVMLETDLAGIDSHGVSMLMHYEELFTAGLLQLTAEPKVVRDSAAIAVIDAGAGLGHPAAVLAMELAVEKAKNFGVGAVSVVNSHHFGAAGYYAALAPRHGLIGLVTTNTRTVSVLPTRAAVPVLGTNPIAFAAPSRRRGPFLLDMSTSTVAVNKVKVYDLNAKPIPAGWVLDEKGDSIRDAALALDYIQKRNEGGVTPLGGTPEMSSHKGYGLSVMVQILSATLCGASFAPVHLRRRQNDSPDNIGHFLLAIDPKAFRSDGGFEADVEAVIDELHGAAPVNPEEPVLVAGDPERASREERLRKGIPVPPALASKIRAVCARWSVPFLLE